MRAAGMPAATAASRTRVACGPSTTSRSRAQAATTRPSSSCAASVSVPSSRISPSTASRREAALAARVCRAATIDAGLALYASLITVMPFGRRSTCMRMLGGSKASSAARTSSSETPASVTRAVAASALETLCRPGTEAHPRRVRVHAQRERLPSRPLSATSSARTSPSVPKRTTGPGKSAAAATTSGSSAFTTAVAEGRSRRNSSASASAAPCSDPTPSRCSGATHVMTPASGCAISASRHTSPGPFMPSSTTATRCDSSSRSRVSGRPTRLFCVPRVCSTASAPNAWRRIAAAISLVVVLPLLPATASTRARRRRR